MSRIILYSVALFVLLTGTSCQDEVQVKLDEGSKIYVIDGFLTNLPEKQVIKVLYNDQFFSEEEASPVTGAQVSVMDLTDEEEFVFTDAGAGSHEFLPQPADGFGVIGHQYELRVKINGKTYTALSTQNRAASITRIDTIFVPEQEVFGQQLPAYYTCTLSAKDAVGAVADYYWIKTFRNDTLLFGPDEIGFSFSIDGTNGEVTGIADDSTNFTAPLTFLAFKQFQKGDKCGVQIHSISRETYWFFIQVGQQIVNGGLFATTPENVRTNIKTPEGATKAVGWFNVATVTEKAVTIPK